MTLPRRAVLILSGLAAIVFLVGATAGSLALAWRGEILPGVRVAGQSVGGMSPDDARGALTVEAEARRTEPVHLTYEDRTFTVRPEQVGFTVDLGATVERARSFGRDRSWWTGAWHHLDAAWHRPELDLVTSVDRDRLQSRIEQVAGEVDQEPTGGAITADPETLEVSITEPADGIRVRRERATTTLTGALRDPGEETVELPVETAQTPISVEQVEEVADSARAALAEPLTLTAAGRELVLEPSQLARVLTLERPDEDTVAVAVPASGLRELLGDAAGTFDVEPTPARFETPRSPPTTFDDQTATTWEPVPVDREFEVLPGEPGARFDATSAARQITSVLREGGHEVALELETVEPELTTEEARGFELTHLLGTFTTYHACCAARVENIHRLADMVDGAVVRPGDQFSINQISGVRRCSKGFEPAGTIVAGELVDTCGGGVSQFGTTTFNAAFFAGVPIDSYKAHSWYISRYPMGREATLNYPSPDLDVRFTNDTGHGMLVKTSYTGTSITVSIYGHSDVESVRATLGSPYDHRGYDTEVREVNSIPEGTSEVIQSGAGGFSVQVRRIITYASGDTEERTFTTVYSPQTRIVLRNPAPPQPPPSPESSPSPGPEQSPSPDSSDQDPGGQSSTSDRSSSGDSNAGT